MGILMIMLFCTITRSKHVSFSYNKGILIFLSLICSSFLLSTIFSITPIQSVFGEYLYAQGLVFYLLLIAHIAACMFFFQCEKNIRLLFLIILFVSCFMSLYAVLQYFNIDPLTNIDNAEFLFRVYSTIGQPNLLGQFLIFPLCISCFFLKDTIQEKHVRGIALYSFCFLLFAITLYLTKNRATWLALTTVVLFWILFFSHIKKSHKKILLLVLSALALIAFFVLEINARSIHSRLILWKGTLNIVDFQHLLFGYGLDTFYQKYMEIMPKEVFVYEKFYTTPMSPHSETLEVFVERGLFGIISYIIPIIFLGYIYVKKRICTSLQQIVFTALVAHLITVQFSFSTVEHWVVSSAFWAILLLQTVQTKKYVLSIKTLPRKIPSLALLAICSCVLIYSSYAFLKTDTAMSKGITQYVNSSPEAFSTLNSATEYSRFYAYPSSILISMFTPFAREDDNISLHIQRHLDRWGRITQYDFKYHVAAIKYAAVGGYKNRAEYHLEQAQKKAPNLPKLYTEAGDMYYKMNDCSTAIFYFEKLQSLAPPYAFATENDGRWWQEEQRIFQKHAFRFYESMNKLMECRNKK
jgi:O-antigen ligase